MSEAADTVRQFCEAVRRKDQGALRASLADDVVYHNIPLDPCEGIEATMAMIDFFLNMAESIEFRLLNLVAEGPVVLTERVDAFTIDGTVHELPVMGTFEVHGGRITAWRDYFDMAQVTAMMTPG
jgi:limonene-1,2-epoxide hydrolase